MAALSAAKRWARLCWWLGLSATTMIIAACGTLFSGGCKSAPVSNKDAGADAPAGFTPDTQPRPDIPAKPDHPSARDAESIDEAKGEANPALDGAKSDLWEIICE